MKFSVVIPCYNVAQYLRECLDSIVAQGCQDWECICVDDGSTDGSGAVLDEYAARDCRFVVVHQTNAGVSAARNAALDRAAGEYVVFVDGDDGLVRNALEVLQELIEKSHADIVKYGNASVGSLGEPVADAVVHGLHVYDLDKCGDAKNAYRLMVGDLIAWNGCYRREALAGLRFLPIPNGEDVAFGAEAFCRARKVAIADARLYRYVRREGSAVRTISLRHVRSALRAIEETARITKEWKWGDAVGNLLARKTRTGLVAGVLPKIRLLPDSERIEAETAFYDCLGRLSWDWKSRRVGKVRSRLLLSLILELPFRVRVQVAKMKIKRAVMHAV